MTTRLTTSKARTQDECVLDYFRSYDNLGATPERVLRHFRIIEKLSERKWHNTPVTSIRRSFTNLKNQGLIQKTNLTIEGDFGKNVHVWKLAR
jgi:transposase-like protein